MSIYEGKSPQQLQAWYDQAVQQLEQKKALGLKLDLTRGKPSRLQQDMVSDIFRVLLEPEDFVSDGIDTRNYGQLSGIPCAKEYFADLLGCRFQQVFVGGNASLQLMYDVVSKAFTHGLLHSPRPWSQEQGLKWLCPVPGYDRHFKISQSFGMELIPIPLDADGPDMALVEQYIQDPSVKGMWNVPKYTNPDGYVYSSETVRRLAAMKPAAPDFLLIWDNAYCVHEFEGDFLPFDNILSLCEEYGNADMVVEFASTSKMTFPGGGISCMAASEANLAYFTKLISIQTIGFDKINQLRHARYLKDRAHTLELMRRHAAVLAPKFHLVFEKLDTLEELGIASYHKPLGGYFVSVNTIPGLAKRTLDLCRESGVQMTAAGATWPYGIDPQDSNIRIAPTYPPLEELRPAMDIFCLCLQIAALEQAMQQQQ